MKTLELIVTAKPIDSKTADRDYILRDAAELRRRLGVDCVKIRFRGIVYFVHNDHTVQKISSKNYAVLRSDVYDK